MSFGPQHDFRAEPHERKDEALEFFRVELPDSTVTSFPVDKAAAYHCLVIEECDHTAGRIDNLAEGLGGIVHSVSGVDHYPHGAEIYFHA